MQSMSLIVDPNLTVGDLAGLGSRLAPPDGWTYQARTLDADLVLQAEGEATVLQDELQNTYQRTAPAMMSQDPTLPVLANGTGTACTSDADCASLDASTCLSGGDTGYCTVEGCTASACGAPYVCCFGCSPQAAALLPFEGSACIPAAAATQLANAAGCTCE